MDSLIVDLDKVLDDFEAEETSGGHGNSKTPTDYANFIAANEDRPWDEISKAPVNSQQWYKSDEEKLTTAVYDVPYIPAENFDLSEADFAPTTVNNHDKFYTGPLDIKGDNFYNDYGKLTTNNVENVFNYVKTDLDVKKFEENHENNLHTNNVINDLSGAIDLRVAKSESSEPSTAVRSAHLPTAPICYQVDVDHRDTIFVADKNCKYPIQVVDFTPVTEHKEFSPASLDMSNNDGPRVNGEIHDVSQMNGEKVAESEITDNHMQTETNMSSDLTNASQVTDNLYATRNDSTESSLSPVSSQEGVCSSLDSNTDVKHLSDNVTQIASEITCINSALHSGGYIKDNRFKEMQRNGNSETVSGGDLTETQTKKSEVVGFDTVADDVESDISEQDIDSYLNDMYAGTSSIGELSSNHGSQLDMQRGEESREFPCKVLNSGYVTSVDIGNMYPMQTPKDDSQTMKESNDIQNENKNEYVSCLEQENDSKPVSEPDNTENVQTDHNIVNNQSEDGDGDIQKNADFEVKNSNSPSSISSFGEGARPKEPMNRPNTLQGLPIIPVDTSSKNKDYSPQYSEAPSCDVLMVNGTLDEIEADEPPMGASPKLQKHQNRIYMNQQLGNPDDAMEGAITNESVDDNDIMEEVSFRRKHGDPPPYMSAESPESARCHSWGPEGSDYGAGAAGQQKRPNSLNLPSLGDLNVNSERSQAPFTFPYDVPNKETVTPETAEITETDIAPETSTGEDVIQEEPIIASGGQETFDEPPADSQTSLGKVAPRWIPDSEAATCMGCDAKFTFTKRRHHCRACGKVFCSACCNLKSKLEYMENKEARVCQSCHQELAIAEITNRTGRSPNPNNPSEYCSTIPPSQQVCARSPPPTVMVPVGVLKREGSSKRSEPKQVMFSDGIRPGGDLTELDGSDTATRIPPRRTSRSQKRVDKASADGARSSGGSGKGRRPFENQRNRCLIPEDGLPPIAQSLDVKTDDTVEENPDIENHMSQIKDDEADPVVFMINMNLFVSVKIINLDCCVSRVCWCFTTKGMCTVGQDEIVIVLEMFPDEDKLPRDILCHFQMIYEEASKGNTVSDMGHTIFNQSFLDNRDHGGMLYIRPTFQCLHKLLLPNPPYVFGILLQKWETPWAKVFPIRLLLRLGAEYRYYPCPLISVRNRKPVFFEIGHTIMNLLADFRNFQYMLPQIKGVSIHMEDKKTLMNFPRNRYDDLMKVVSNSNEHVMAIGASFSSDADSHLVCIQNDDGNYQTQAINIQNKPRKVTGASFVVFNGALKTSSGLKAKSSIVEDGLMVQITPESMAALKQAMKDMLNYTVECGSINNPAPDEVVVVQWVDDDKRVNIGVKSPVDNRDMGGVESIHIPNATDYVGENRLIRWTDVFFIQNDDGGSAKWEPVDLSRLAETLSNAFCIAVTRHLDKLKELSLTKIGLRVNIEPDKVGYECGALGEKLPDVYMNDLDNELIPVIHSAASQNHGGAIVLELIFHILE